MMPLIQGCLKTTAALEDFMLHAEGISHSLCERVTVLHGVLHACHCITPDLASAPAPAAM